MITVTAVIAIALAFAAFLGRSYAAANFCDYQGAIRSYEEMCSIIAEGGQKGCCPKIVPQSSLIAADSGYRGNVAIIVDWGTCTAQPAGGFLWYVDWGDGTYSFKRTDTLGPFQATYQYSACQNSYSVFVYYCSTPPHPNQRCCDIFSGTIDARQ